MSNLGIATVVFAVVIGVVQFVGSLYVTNRVKAYFDEKLAERNSILNEKLEQVRAALNNSRELFLKRLAAHEAIARLVARSQTHNDLPFQEKLMAANDSEKARLVGTFNKSLFPLIGACLDDFGVYFVAEASEDLNRAWMGSRVAWLGPAQGEDRSEPTAWMNDYQYALIVRDLRLAEFHMRKYVRGLAGEELTDAEQRSLDQLFNPDGLPSPESSGE